MGKNELVPLEEVCLQAAAGKTMMSAEWIKGKETPTTNSK
jgi:hypothetical protein